MLLLNILLPGAGLILRGRFVLGIVGLVLCMLFIGALILSPLIATPELSAQCLSIVIPAYLVLSVFSSTYLFLISRKPQWDQQQLRQLHQQASGAYLQEQWPQALQAAQQLCKQAGSVIGSWQLLALIADASGDLKLAHKARQRAKLLLEEDL